MGDGAGKLRFESENKLQFYFVNLTPTFKLPIKPKIEEIVWIQLDQTNIQYICGKSAVSRETVLN